MPDPMRILVRASGVRRTIALLDENKLAEYYVEEDSDHSLVNAVFLGRVDRVVQGMDAAFVQIGQALNGFLPLKEAESFTQTDGEPLLRAGQEILVQVKKDAKDQKGAFLSRDIALPGQYLIYMPLNRYIGVSKRVAREVERESLKEIGESLANGQFGLVMRGAALFARQEELLSELETLREQFRRIQEKSGFVKAPAPLYREPSVLASLVRDYAPRYGVTITCNDAVNRMPVPPNGLLWEQVGEPELDALWSAAHIDAQLAEALDRHVLLRNGGTIVIDEREALTTVDVNSARFVGDREGDFALRQNIAACDDIARQLRLRNLSGILLIDFIDMETDEQRAQVMARLEAELSRERVKTVLHGFTSLGLLEMTRKRTGASLRGLLQTPCDRCNGTGYRMERERKS